MSNVKSRVRQFRRREKMSVIELATAAGVTRQAIYLIESGGVPHLELALKLANIFDVSVEELFSLRKSRRRSRRT